MSTVNGTWRNPRGESQAIPADKVVVNLEATPTVASHRGVSDAVVGARSSPIDVEAIEDEVQAVSPSQVPPPRRNRRTVRPVTLVDLEVDSSMEGIGNKRQRVVHCLSPDMGQGSSLQSNGAVQTGKEPAKEAPKEPIFTCPVCLNKLEEPSTTTCGHIFCTDCIKQAIKVQKKCPTCRKKLRTGNHHRIYLPNSGS